MKRLLFIVAILTFIECSKGDSECLMMKISDVSIYLNDPTGEGKLPPILQIKINIDNSTQKKMVFIAQSNYDANDISKLIMIDTLNKKILPLFSDDTQILMPKSKAQVEAYIELREVRDYLGLSINYFSKVDYTKDELLLKKLCTAMLKNSEIIYRQNKNHAIKQRLFDEGIVPIEGDIKIAIPKDFHIR